MGLRQVEGRLQTPLRAGFHKARVGEGSRDSGSLVSVRVLWPGPGVGALCSSRGQAAPGAACLISFAEKASPNLSPHPVPYATLRCRCEGGT